MAWAWTLMKLISLNVALPRIVEYKRRAGGDWDLQRTRAEADHVAQA
jgi:hypothetical protein